MEDQPKILVHSCCAPCYSVLHGSLKDTFKSINLFWYNPNIHPFTEYRNRYRSLKKFAETTDGLDLISIHQYDISEFIRNCAFREKNRCWYCYWIRLDLLGKTASNRGFSHFTTSLLASPYQKHDQIVEICKHVEKQYNAKFFYEDFRKEWKRREISIREKDLYRQQYCGCIYSEEDRYARDIKNLT